MTPSFGSARCWTNRPRETDRCGFRSSMPDIAASLLSEARHLVYAELEQHARRLAREVDGETGAALAYALRSPGKRVRPALVLAAYRAAGGDSPAIAGVATAIEVVHTYSLVHDDLPCMDDDDMRR